MMQAAQIKDHWTDWAVKYGTDERATTLCSSIKRLEIDALRRSMEKLDLSRLSSVLEVGCGNGQNIIALAKIFDHIHFWAGIDYIPEMIEAARNNAIEKNVDVSFDIGNVLDLSIISPIGFDIVFTDRLIINLDTIEKQLQAIDGLVAHITSNGALIMIENSRQTKDAQNDLREALGLFRRRDAEFNLFLDDEIIIPYFQSLFKQVEIEDFGSLHDILLYALLPASTGTEFHYDDAIMRTVADLCTKIPISAGSYGQNRLYFCREKR